MEDKSEIIKDNMKIEKIKTFNFADYSNLKNLMKKNMDEALSSNKINLHASVISNNKDAIVICGLCGSGKTLLGLYLSRRLNLDYISDESTIIENWKISSPKRLYVPLHYYHSKYLDIKLKGFTKIYAKFIKFVRKITKLKMPFDILLVFKGVSRKVKVKYFIILSDGKALSIKKLKKKEGIYKIIKLQRNEILSAVSDFEKETLRDHIIMTKKKLESMPRNVHIYEIKTSKLDDGMLDKIKNEVKKWT